MKENKLFKKIASISFAMLLAFVGIVLVFELTSCADPDGLHNQQAAEVTITFTNFPENVSGDYSLPGDYNGDDSWENEISNVDIVMKNGEGTSNPITVTSSWIKFSLVKTGDTSWLRGWSGEVAGNSADNGKYVNFWSNIDLSAGEITLVVDGSSGTAVVTAE